MTTLLPAPPLDALVETIWDWDVPQQAHALERILPSASATLIINLGEDQTRVYDDALRCQRLSGTVLDAPSHRGFIIDTAEQVAVMGVVFKPAGAAAFFRERMDVLANRHLELGDLLPRSAGLRARLLEAKGAIARLRILNSWLVRCAGSVSPRPAVREALRQVEDATAVHRIGAIAAHCRLSPRRLGEMFREDVGMSPKRYIRLRRFQQAADRAHRGANVEWAAIAADCGYHDQAHLSHEFRAFSGMTPGAYLANKGEWVAHIPLPTPDCRNLQDTLQPTA